MPLLVCLKQFQRVRCLLPRLHNSAQLSSASDFSSRFLPCTSISGICNRELYLFLSSSLRTTQKQRQRGKQSPQLDVSPRPQIPGKREIISTRKLPTRPTKTIGKPNHFQWSSMQIPLTLTWPPTCAFSLKGRASSRVCKILHVSCDHINVGMVCTLRCFNPVEPHEQCVDNSGCRGRIPGCETSIPDMVATL